MNRCSRCRAPLPRGAIRCSRCGETLADLEELTELDADEFFGAEGASAEDLPPALGGGYEDLPPALGGNYEDLPPALGGGDEGKQPGWDLDGQGGNPWELDDELELAAESPHQERARKSEIEQQVEQSEQDKARRIADYGEPPASVSEAALYTFWVLWRKIWLFLALRGLGVERSTVKSRFDAVCRQAGASLYEQRGDAALAACRDELIAVADADERIRLALEKDQRVRESVSQEMEYVVETIFHTQKDTEPFRAEQARLLAEVAKREEQKKGIEAEIRAAEQWHREHLKGEKGEADQDWLRRVQRDLQAKNAQLEQLAQEMDGLRIDLEEMKVELRDAEKKVQELHLKRKAQLAQRMKSAERREAERQEAQKELDSAMAALGRRGYELQLELIAPAERERIGKVAEELQGKDEQISLYRTAMASHDRRGLATGLFSIGSAVVLLVGSLIALSLLFGSPPPGGAGGTRPADSGAKTAAHPGEPGR